MCIYSALPLPYFKKQQQRAQPLLTFDLAFYNLYTLQMTVALICDDWPRRMTNVQTYRLTDRETERRTEGRTDATTTPFCSPSALVTVWKCQANFVTRDCCSVIIDMTSIAILCLVHGCMMPRGASDIIATSNDLDSRESVITNIVHCVREKVIP